MYKILQISINDLIEKSSKMNCYNYEDNADILKRIFSNDNIKTGFSLGGYLAGGSAFYLFNIATDLYSRDTKLVKAREIKNVHNKFLIYNDACGKFRKADISDFDMFFVNSKQSSIYDAYINKNNKNSYVSFESGNSEVLERITHSYSCIIQCIASNVGTITEVLSRFDLVNCQVAVKWDDDYAYFKYYETVPELEKARKLDVVNYFDNKTTVRLFKKMYTDSYKLVASNAIDFIIKNSDELISFRGLKSMLNSYKTISSSLNEEQRIKLIKKMYLSIPEEQRTASSSTYHMVEELIKDSAVFSSLI